ncbi:MAG: sulfate adenylyltransferase [Candidatus Micrarchaeota archaeon]
MIEAHGGKLIERCTTSEETNSNNDVLEIDSDTFSEIANISHGVFSPLSGFMNSDELESVLSKMRLPDGNAWTMPILLPVQKKYANGERIFFRYEGKNIGFIDIEETFNFDRRTIAKNTFGTDDIAHPGAAEIMKKPDLFAGGKVTLLAELDDEFSKFHLSPRKTRECFREKGWQKVVGFQTRNAPHLGHEYVQRTALESVDGLFINPVFGKKKSGDLKDKVIIKTYNVLIKNYLPNALLGILRTKMRYAGPREAVFHAIIRKNFGCSHFIVGRDHAGVGKYYEPYAAHEIFNEFPNLGITPLFFKAFFFCSKCEKVVGSCNHGSEFHKHFSGTRIREKILARENPDDMMRPEVLDIILEEKNPFV